MDEARAAARQIANEYLTPSHARVQHLEDAILALVADAVAQATRAERERWIDYVEWFVQASQGAYTMAWIHGHRDGDELIEEGKRRRAVLNYVPKAEALRRAPTAPTPGGKQGPR